MAEIRPIWSPWKSCCEEEKEALRFRGIGTYVGTWMQGCQMAYFHIKNTNLDLHWRALEWKMLVHFVVVWCIFFRFGMLYQEKSGNPANDVLVIFWREKVAGKEIGIWD
jgi:hypothetical protein